MNFRKNLLLLLLVLASSPWLSAQKLLKSQKIGTVSKFELQLVYGGLIRYGIDLHKVWYLTPNIAGKPDTASGLVVFPQVEGVPQPLLCYQHGTVDGPADVPSNRAGGWELAGVGAALGYVACTADYLGLGESKGFHPYIHAATEASCAVDLLYATRELAKQLNFPLKNQLFLTGYSQGGHASMALHRLLEQNYTKDFPVTAAAHLSGPYSVSGETYKRLLSEEPYFYVGYSAWVILSYNQMYNIYDDIGKVLKQPYADMAKQFFRREITQSKLNSMLIAEMNKQHGKPLSRYMIQDSVLANMAKSPNHPLLRAMRDNDTYDWTPKAPTRMFYCKGDDQVTFRNSVVADSVMRKRGARDVAALDVNELANHTQCIQPAVTQTVFFFAGVQSTTSTRQVENNLPVKMYPNPVTGNEVRLEGLPNEGQIQVFNANGQLLRSSTISGNYQELPLQGLPKGLYNVQVIGEKGAWRGRLLMQ
jgi:hypothetical protein